jgi:hypothetical protein
MIQIPSLSEQSVTAQKDSNLLCFYTNATSQIQVVRITNIPKFYWEKVVFPGQRLLFETVADARLEILTDEKGTSIVTDVIPCQQLRVIERTHK